MTENRTIPKVTFVIIVSTLILLANITNADLITRKEVHEAIIKNMSVVDLHFEGFTQDKKEAFIKALNIPKIINDSLPAELEVKNQKHKQKLLSGIAYVIEYPNLEYEKLNFEFKLKTFIIYCHQSNNLPDLTAPERLKIEKEISTLMEGLKKSLNQHAGKYFTQKEIETAIERRQNELLNHIDSPRIETLKKPVGDRVISKVLSTFDKRLKLTKDRIPNRLNSGINENTANRAQMRSVNVMLLFNEILNPVKKIMENKSRVETGDIDTETIVNGYSELSSQVSNLWRKLIEESRIQESKKRKHMELMEEILEDDNSMIDSYNEILENAHRSAHEGNNDKQEGTTANASQNATMRQSIQIDDKRNIPVAINDASTSDFGNQDPDKSKLNEATLAKKKKATSQILLSVFFVFCVILIVFMIGRNRAGRKSDCH